MKSDLFINDKDAWLTWGVCIEDGSENALLLPATNKELIENKNANEHGKRVLMQKRFKEDRDVIVMFSIHAESIQDYFKKFESFVEELDSGFVVLASRYLSKVYNLTTTSYQDLGFYGEKGKISVKFNEPNPTNRGAVFTQQVIATEDNRVLLTEEEKGFEV